MAVRWLHESYDNAQCSYFNVILGLARHFDEVYSEKEHVPAALGCSSCGCKRRLSVSVERRPALGCGTVISCRVQCLAISGSVFMSSARHA
eukprot:8398-Heterococcus_DN1.PRE.5